MNLSKGEEEVEVEILLFILNFLYDNIGLDTTSTEISVIENIFKINEMRDESQGNDVRKEHVMTLE